MKKPFLNVMAAVSLLGNVAAALADDELVVNAYRNGEVATGLVAKLDGSDEKIIDKNGMALFDLSAGAHSIQIIDNGTVVHSFRFNSAVGQYADINIQLKDGKKPKVNFDAWFKKESAIERSQASIGGVMGVVLSNGVPVNSAEISVKGTKVSTQTDANGNYELKLPRGIYELVVSHPGMGSREISDFRVVGNVVKGSNFTISQQQSVIEEVMVLAKVNTNGSQESERYSVNVIDTLGAEQLSRFGDSDIAGAVIRVPSVTVENGRNVFIRGLGGRYITTTLNGATLPSTDPAKRTVPLDLFPSNIVSQLDIKKTFVASMPGESTGGNLVINTRSFPNEREGKLSFSLGYDTGITGEDALVDPTSGDWDSVGWDDGARDVDARVVAISSALDQSDSLSTFAQTELSRQAALLLIDDLDLDTKKAGPNISIGANFGDVITLDSSDADFGYFVAANYKNTWSHKDDGIKRTLSGTGVDILDDFTFEEYSNDIDVSGLLSLGLNWGDSTYRSNTLVSRITESRVEQLIGLDGDASLQSRRHNIDWEERQFISQQFTGEHIVDEEGNLTADWQITVSQATREAPDRREIRFDLEDGDGIFNLVIPSVLRRFDDLTDDNIDFSTNFKYMIDSSGDSESNIAAGIQVISRERESNSATYGFVASSSVVDDNSPNLLVSEIITPDNITGDRNTGIGFSNKTLDSDSYDAEMDMNAVYVSYDSLFMTEYQVIVGVRYEDYDRITNTTDLLGNFDPAPLNEEAVLPSLGFNWYFKEDQQIRFALSQTVSRPDFKETSNAVFYDEKRRRIRGNPRLQISDVTNFDVRWEKYWSDNETLSVALFYKDIDDPIERVILTASGTASDSRTFRNSDAAEIYGIEIDGRKDFIFNDSATQSLFVAVNASVIESESEFSTEDTRALQGQPDYTFNLILGYDDIERNQELTVLFNQNGDSIEDVGLDSRPDVIEEPRLDININYQYYLDENIVIKAKISNLLDSEVEFTQGGRIVESYKEGVEFQAGVEWTF